jgi:hypothetical protein
MHPEMTAAYSAARAQELRRTPAVALRPRTYWRVRRREGVAFRLPAPRSAAAALPGGSPPLSREVR